MPFVSLNYYFFLFFTIVAYSSIQQRLRGFVLLFASYLFYMSFNPKYIFFILGTTFVSFFAARAIQPKTALPGKTIILSLALGFEGTLLFLTKYWTLVAVESGLFNPINILVPLGISFYTFQSVGYLFDVYRGNTEAEQNFGRYALFLSFFPHLLAGPIEPAQSFLPQIKIFPLITLKNIISGISLILLGLFKKLLIADRLAPIVDKVFNDPTSYKGSAVGVGLLLARYQIFCDFSGYTDIALGSALLFGITLTQNFNRPFAAISISDYWRRWHISLASWIRNYIFYPLVSTPISRIGVHGLILLTFLVLGLWHGGTANFMIYGLWHGCFVILDSATLIYRQKFYERIGLVKYPTIHSALGVVTTFLFIVVPPTLFFRSPNFNTSTIMAMNLFSEWSLDDLNFLAGDGFLTYSLGVSLIGIIILEIFQWSEAKFQTLKALESRPLWLVGIFWFCLLGLILGFGLIQQDSNFIYMRF